MKLKALLAVATLAVAPGLQAFTLDFASSVGSTIPSTLIVNVPGYGDVSFSAGFNAVQGITSALEVGTDFFGAPSLQFDNGDTVYVNFLGTLPSDVSFEQVAISTGTNEEFIVLQTGSNEFIVSLQNSGNGAGILAANFNAAQVPEPSASLLGLVGLTGLVIRRRR
ncbi:MAG TPA: PEP-CTERM sorting domain-containing protein [Luteolibacter sp.]|nr:PEP-CTERM sorting domain-containing protein [Luteolibacter sp.]